MFIRNLVLSLLMAIVVWSISFLAFYWPKTHPLLSLQISILGALLVVIILVLAKHFGVVLSLNRLLAVGLGAAIGLLVASIIIPAACKSVIVNCNNQPPIASPDEVGAYLGETICWQPTTVGYTVEFKQSNTTNPINNGRRSPVRNALGGEEIYVTVTTAVAGRIVNATGYYYYNITCDNGNHVDPKVRIPPRW